MRASLNHIFRTIWSEVLGAWIAVSELTKTRGKRSGGSQTQVFRLDACHRGQITFKSRLTPLVFALACCFSLGAQANPMGGNVVSGQASFNNNGNTLTVTNTPGTIIHWQDFSIQRNEITRFAQQSASSAVMNRVVGGNTSQILGALQSNGRVFLVNPNGIVFGAGSTVDVAGLVATSLNLSDADFLAGRHRFTNDPNAQTVSNAGNITAQSGGEIWLIAPNVENSGVITAPNGEILLAAGSSVELVNSLDPNLRVNITAPAGDATNVGQLVASAGRLGLFGTVVRNSGSVSADSATLQGGKIVFRSSRRTEVSGTISASGVGGGEIKVLSDMQAGTVSVSGTLDASAPTSGDGGFIDTSAAHFDIKPTAHIVATAANGKAGEWLIDPLNVTIGTGVDTGGTFTGGIWMPITSGSFITSATIEAALNQGTNVTITTANAGFAEAGDITVTSNITMTGAAPATLTLQAENDIIFNAGAVISSTNVTPTALNVVLNADSDGVNGGAIVMNSGSSIISNGGNITLGGGVAGNGTGNATGNVTYTKGIYLTGATLNAGGGNIALRGTGFAGTTFASGIYITSDVATGTVDSAISTIGTGTITLNGTGGAGTGNNSGIRIGGGTTVAGTGTTLSSADGLISLTGQGGASTGTSNYGIDFHNGSTIAATGTGGITLTGTGGSSGATNHNTGIAIQSGAAISVVDGALAISGTSGAGSGTYNRGVNVLASQVKATGLGGITITGYSNATSTSSFGSGVELREGGLVQSASGAIGITGSCLAGTCGLGTSENKGIYIHDATVASGNGAAQVLSTSGNITLTGTAWGTGAPNYGIHLFNDSVLSAALSATVDAGVGGSSNISLVAAAGDIVLGTGTVAGANTSGNLSLNAGRDIIFNTALTRAVGGSANFSAANNILFAANSALASPAGVTLNSGGTITLTGISAGNVSVTAAGNINSGSGGATDITATGTVDLTAAGIGYYQSFWPYTTNRVGVSAGGAVTLATTGAGNLGNIYLRGDAAMALGSVTTDTATAQTVDLLQQTGSLTMPATQSGNDNWVVNSTPGITFLPGSSLTASYATFSGSGITAQGNLSVRALTGDLNFYNTPLTASGIVTLLSDNGSLTLGAVTASNTGLPVTTAAISASAPMGGINLYDGMTASGSGGISLLAGYSIDLDYNDIAPNLVTAAGNVNIKATGGSITNTGSARVTGASVLLDGALGVGTGDIITATSGSVTVLAAGGTASLTGIDAATDVSVTANSIDSSYGNIAATGGNISLISASDIILYGYWGGNALTTNGGNVLLNADWDGLNGGAIAMLGAGSITSNGGNITLGGGTAGNGTGNAAGNATYVNGIELQGTTINSGGGNVALNGTGANGGASGDGINVSAGSSINTGTGTLNLTATGSNLNIAGNVSSGIFSLNSGTWNQVAAVLPLFSANDFRIAGGTFIRALGGNGTALTPYQLTDIYGVQGMGSAGMLGNSYVLANDINASGTANWNAGAGFAPIGNATTNFTGTFDGQSYTINGLAINLPATSDVGLFGKVGVTGAVNNLGLVGSSVSGYRNVGGLVGNNFGSISSSYSSGMTVNGYRSVGGLVGDNSGVISNSYSVGGTVSGSFDFGGLVGANWDTINTTYSTNAVALGGGGLMGWDEMGYTNNSYWDTQTSGVATRNGTETGLTTAQMQTLSSFTGWNIANTGGAGATWRIYEGQTAPLLTSYLTPLTVSVAGSRVYNASTDVSSLVTYSQTPNANLLGTAVANTSSANAGTYSVTPSGHYSNQTGYDISYASGSVTISPAGLQLLSLTANDASKMYGTTYSFTGTEFTPVGLMGGDSISSLTLTSTGAVATAHAGNYAIVPSNAVFGTGSAGNYDISYVNGTLTVTPRPVTITALAANKVYGDADPTLFNVGGPYGLTAWDTKASAFSGRFSHTGGENVGTYTNAITQGTFTSSNYSISSFAPNTLTITPATLTVYADDLNKVLGTSDPLLTYRIYGLKFSDTAASTLDGQLIRDSGETIGSYSIGQGTLAVTSGNYNTTFVYNPGTFSILAPTVVQEITQATVETLPGKETTASSDEEEKKKAEQLAQAEVEAQDDGAQLADQLPVCR